MLHDIDHLAQDPAPSIVSPWYVRKVESALGPSSDKRRVVGSVQDNSPRLLQHDHKAARCC